VTAAHIGGFNSGNTGIALLGTLTARDPTPSARAMLEDLLGELTARHGIDATGASMYVNPVNGVTRTVANISGHRDWSATECPGETLYALLPAIRDTVAGTPPVTDTTAPVITALTAAPKPSNATVRWTTDEASTTLVEYRRAGSTSWIASAHDARLTTGHSMTVNGLARRTTYEYRATSSDALSNTSTTPVSSFVTK